MIQSSKMKMNVSIQNDEEHKSKYESWTYNSMELHMVLHSNCKPLNINIH